MNTIENNNIIAEFMNSEVTIDTYFITGMYISINENDLKYHSDWNWLMEVVEKIESLGYAIEINKQEEDDYQCLVVKKDILIQEFSNIKIEAVYNACLEFIKQTT